MFAYFFLTLFLSCLMFKPHAWNVRSQVPYYVVGLSSLPVAQSDVIYSATTVWMRRFFLSRYLYVPMHERVSWFQSKNDVRTLDADEQGFLLLDRVYLQILFFNLTWILGFVGELPQLKFCCSVSVSSRQTSFTLLHFKSCMY